MRKPGPYKFSTWEKVKTGRPLVYQNFLSNKVLGKTVLDIGCLDETAVDIKPSRDWLHYRLGQSAKKIVGIDNSELLLEHGGQLDTGFSQIHHVDLYSEELDKVASSEPFEVVVMSMVMEHLPDVVAAVSKIRTTFPSSELIFTTTNATGFTNVAAALFQREIQHQDHICTYSFKTLDVVMSRAGISNFVVYPGHGAYTEARLRSGGLSMFGVKILEKILKGIEWVFPMYSTALVIYCPASK